MERQILEAITIGIVTIDPTETITFWNQWMENASGMDSGVTVGKNVFDVFPNLDTVRFRRRIKSSFVHGNYWYFSHKIHKYLFPFKPYMQGKSDMEFMQQRCTMGPVYGNDGEIDAVFITVDDVTDLVLSENQLKQALKDKDMLMREVHHRVKNNLGVIQSLLSLQLRDISDDKSKAYFHDARNRVRSMTMIHEMLQSSDDLTRMRTKDYIEKFVGTLVHNYNVEGRPVKLHHDIQDVIVDVDTMIPLGLIINELVSNALKYALAGEDEGELSIVLRETGERTYELMVKDNGPGLPKDFDLTNAKSLGLLIVNSLVRQIKGTLESSNNNGAEFKVSFKEVDII